MANYCNTNDNPFKEYYGYPAIWNNILNYPNATQEQHESDGFYELIIPTYDTAIEYLGVIEFDIDHFTYTILSYTAQEIQNRKVSEAQSAQIELAQSISLNNIIIAEQQNTDPNTNLQNQSLFPFWNSDAFVYAIGIKVQGFDASNEVWLYKCVQSHTSQIGWKPYLTPSLWTKVTPSGQAYVWVQPTGAQDAYQINDLVHYPTISDPIYKSTVNANVYAPGVVAGQWVIQP